MTAVAESRDARTADTSDNGVGRPDGGEAGRPVAKPGGHREATLYRALAGAGAADGRTLAQLREAALSAYEALELPVWRRSGFWTTSLQSLDLDALRTSSGETGEDAVPEVVQRTLPERPRAGRIVQTADATVQLELDPELRARGVLLCSLEDAFREHPELVAQWYSRRLTIDRHKLEAANAAFWSAGAFLYVPPEVVVTEPFEIVYTIEQPGIAQYGRTLVLGGQASEFKLHEYDLGEDFEGQALHAGAFELYLEGNARCRLAHLQDWGAGDVFDISTHFVRVGRDAHCTWVPIHLGGHVTRQHIELSTAEQGSDMRHRGIYFTEGTEHLDLFTVDLHEAGNTTGDTVWKGASTGQSRASYEGLIKIVRGAQESHTYLQTHSLMLSPKAKVDAIPSLIVETDSVSASHGGTVGEVDEQMIFYMRTRGLSRQDAIKVIVEGYFEPIIVQLEDDALEELVRERIAAKLAAAADDIEAYAAAK